MAVNRIGTFGSILCEQNQWLESASLFLDSANQLAVSTGDGIQLTKTIALGNGTFGTIHLFQHGELKAAVKMMKPDPESDGDPTFTILDAPRPTDPPSRRAYRESLLSIFGEIDCRVVYTAVFDLNNTTLLLMEVVDTTALNRARQLNQMPNTDTETVSAKVTEVIHFAEYALSLQLCSMDRIKFSAADFKLDNVGATACDDRAVEYNLIDSDSVVLLADPVTNEELVRTTYYPAAYWLQGAMPYVNGRYRISEARLNSYFQTIVAIIEFACIAFRVPERQLSWFTLFRKNGSIEYYQSQSPHGVYLSLVQTISTLQRFTQAGDGRWNRLAGRVPTAIRHRLVTLLSEIKHQLTGFFGVYRRHGLVDYKEAGSILLYFGRGKKGTLPTVEAELTALASSWGTGPAAGHITTTLSNPFA